MPGNLTISTTNNSGQSASRSLTAASNAQYLRLERYIMGRFGVDDQGAQRTPAQAQAQAFQVFAEFYLTQIKLDVQSFDIAESQRAARASVADVGFS